MRHAFALIPLAALCASPATADPLLDRARAAIDAEGPLYAYEMEYSDGDMQATGKVDPSQPEGQRLTIYSPEESAWDEDFRMAVSALDKDVTGDIFCDDFAQQIPGDARRTAETGDTVEYAFTPQAKEGADGNERKMMKKIDASAVLSKDDGQILSLRMTLPKPFKPAMVAKVDTFRLDISCARAPDGRTYLEDMRLDLAGSAMMQSFEQSVTRRITRLLGPVEKT